MEIMSWCQSIFHGLWPVVRSSIIQRYHGRCRRLLNGWIERRVRPPPLSTMGRRNAVAAIAKTRRRRKPGHATIHKA